MGRTSGLVQAEGSTVSSASSSDKVVIYQYDTNVGQYTPRDITVANLLTGGGTSFTEGSIIFADSTGSLAEDNTNLFWNDSTNTARITNLTIGTSGTLGSFKVYQATASKGYLALAAVANTGDTATTISNAAMGQASTISIPDPGASTANFVLDKANQTVAGNKTFTGTTEIDILKVGASGTVGAFNVYPTTASKGSLRILAADSAGYTVTTFTNDSQAAARAYTIPDAGTDASFVMTAGAQTIAGVKTFTGDITASAANIIAATAGKGLQIKEGSNARMGTSTLSSGTVTVSNTSVTANTRIFLSRYAPGASTALGILSVGTVTASTSFVINALKEADATVQTNDVSVVHWMLIEPAA